MRDFLSAIWGDLEERELLGELRVINKGKVIQTFHERVDFAEAAAGVANVGGADVYFGVLPRTRAEGTADATVKQTDVLWADFDGKAYPAGKMDAFGALASVLLPPQIIIDSGNGYHAYWLLDDMYPFDQAQPVMKGIERGHGSDHCSDAARVLRVPGTDNHKDGFLKPVRLIRFDLTGRRHRLSDFSDYIEIIDPRPPRPVRQRTTDGWEYSDTDAPPFPEGTRNHSLTRLAGIMVARGMDEDELLAALLHENAVRCVPPLPDREVIAIARSVGRYR